MINIIDYFLDNNKINEDDSYNNIIEGFWWNNHRKRLRLAELRRQKKEREDRLKLLREKRRNSQQLANLQSQVERLKKKGMQDTQAYTKAIQKLQKAELHLAKTTEEISKETKEINGLKNLIKESEETANQSAKNVLAVAGKAKKASGEAIEEAGKAKKASGEATEAAGKATEAAGEATDAAGKATEAGEIIEKTADMAKESTLNPIASAMDNQNQLDQVNKIIGKDSFTNLFEGFLETNINMEPFTGNTPQPQSGFTQEQIQDLENLQDILQDYRGSLEDKKQAIKEAINKRKLFQDTEYLLQEDSILNKLIMDYLINEGNNTNIEKVYEELDQDNKNKLRKTQINTYYTKAYKEYIFLLKIVVAIVLLMFPIIILNRLEFLSNNLTTIFATTIIVLGGFYVLYRIYLLKMRDNKEFDKFRVPYDRQAAQLQKKGLLEKKGSPLKGFGITCIGDECCDASMVYDNLKNKCVLSENFGNYFENLNNYNYNSKSKVIEPHNYSDNMNNIEPFITNEKHVDAFNTQILVESLNKSTLNKF
tara:strand:+ start:1428 stop:3041 length:1614 start_codon:yes stop_codon:yes gene_type:complete